MPAAHHLLEQFAANAGNLPAIGSLLALLTAPVLNGLAGIFTGAAVLALVSVATRVYRSAKGQLS